jgi:mxaJ protein
MTALERGDIDIAVVWGPTAGYFANKAPMELRITPVSPDPDGDLKFSFAIAVGVQKGDEALKEEINRVLAARQQEIERILKDYKVPLLPLQASPVQTAEKK